MHIYDKNAWERLKATANAVASFTAYSTYMDGRAGNSTAAFTALGSTALITPLFHAYEPPKNRHHIMRVMAS